MMDGLTIEKILKQDILAYKYYAGSLNLDQFPESPATDCFYLVNSSLASDKLGVSIDKKYANATCVQHVCNMCE